MRNLLELKDGGIVSFDQDNWCQSSGCETCGYGSSYISELTISMTKHKIYIESDEMYEYGLSDGIVMKVILNNVNKIQEMTEMEFANWVIEQFDSECTLTRKDIV